MWPGEAQASREADKSIRGCGPIPGPAPGMRGSLLEEVDRELGGGGPLFCLLLHPQCLEWGLAVSRSCQSLQPRQVESQLSQVLKEEQIDNPPTPGASVSSYVEKGLGLASKGLAGYSWNPCQRTGVGCQGGY